eukprot:TRINITY_DN1862_c0_g1_i1.p1 TRINITY_DN1862_c0_g1~~TRINITY_DN1862_c0_g1_i1.p1  ORF type:complete len:185 (-),score=72.08 TRINITY_DN1862_c0_g1_i1:110-604(-)
MKILLLLVLVAVVSCAQFPAKVNSGLGGKIQWSLCSNQAYPFSITQLAGFPDPPVIGQTVNVTLVGTLSGETITKGTVTFSLLYHQGPIWVPVPGFPLNLDLCTSSGVKCPIPPNHYNFKTSVPVPGFTPPGDYKGVLTLVDQDNKPLSCLNWSASLVSSDSKK